MTFDENDMNRKHMTDARKRGQSKATITDVDVSRLRGVVRFNRPRNKTGSPVPEQTHILTPCWVCFFDQRGIVNQ